MGDQELLRRSTGNSIGSLSTNTYPIVTRQNWQIRCLAAMDSRNGALGEAFIAVSPDGTEYRFDWLVARDLENLTKSSSAPEARGVAATLQAESSTDGSGGGVKHPIRSAKMHWHAPRYEFCLPKLPIASVIR